MLDTFPDFLSTDSIFQKMVSMGAPWNSTVGKSMDVSFFTMYSGLKLPSYFVRMNVNKQNVVNSSLIAETLWNIYGNNWKRLWDVYMAEYNPIQNYDIKEEVKRDQTDDRTIGRNGTLSSTVDGTGTRTTDSSGSSSLEHGHVQDTIENRERTENDSETSSLKHGHVQEITENRDRTENNSGTSALQHGEIISTTGTVNEFRFGMNSSDPVPTANQNTSGQENHTGTDTTTTSGENKITDDNSITQTNSGTDTTTASGDSTISDDNTIKQTNSGTDVTTTKDDSTVTDVTKNVRADTTAEDTTDNDIFSETISRTRTGNVGQNSYQELLKQEFELWKWNFFWSVFEDCDKFLCLSVFDTCQIP